MLVSDGLLGLGGNIVNIVMGHMGAAVVASNSICMVIERLFTVMIQGISNASSIITGNTIGSGQIDKARRQGETFYLLSMVLGLVPALLVFLFGPMTIGLYKLAPETVVVAREMMSAYAVVTLFQAVRSIMTKGVLRGGGGTKFLMKTDILFIWIVSILLGALAGLVFHWPAWATLLCLRADYIIKSVWCVSRLLSGKWIHEADDLRRSH